MKLLPIVLLVLAILVTAGLARRKAPLDPQAAPSPRLSPFGTDSQAADARGEQVDYLPFDPITRLELLDHVRTLASDAMEGRRTGEPGADRAATYIEDEFRRAGLRPGGDEGSYRQSFQAQLGARMGEKNRLVLKSPGGPVVMGLDSDWRPLSFSTRGQLLSPITFCGYGITANDPPYDDYAGQDVRDRVVLLLRYEPGADDPHSPFGGSSLTMHADLRNKTKNAFDHGAAGVLVVTGPATQQDDLLPFDTGADAGSGHLPAAQLRRPALSPLLDVVEVDLAAVQARIDQTYQPYSFPLDLTVEMEVDVEPVEAEAFNVIGILRGGDPAFRDEAIVVGAHYDHLGRGGKGSLAPDTVAIHNGADDNASGVAAVIEIAAALATTPAEVRRSIVFVAFTGEELGLLGSSYYVEHPAMPLALTRAMINLDMVGRGRDREVLIGGAGTSPDLRQVVEEEARADFLSPVFSEGGYGPSDHTAFYARDIPVLFFSSAPHEDYHRPTDDWEKVDLHYLEMIARLAQRVTGRLAGEVAEIRFVRADTGGPPGSRPGGEGYGTRGYGPFLGTVPDFGPSKEGVRLSGVRQGSPAEIAGLRRGDLIVGWDRRRIFNLEDYAAALRSQRPGDRVEIEFLRDGATQRAVAVLGERR